MRSDPIETLVQSYTWPETVVVTAGMPYANGPLHLGHLAGAQIPADIYARFMRMAIGSDKVLFVCGTDDHGSTSELSALSRGQTIENMVRDIHAEQLKTLARYDLSLDIYGGTSHPSCREFHFELSQDFLRQLHKNGYLHKKLSRQWYEPTLGRYLQDRLVRGTCPNPKCLDPRAYSDSCETCGASYDPSELKDPICQLNGQTPELRDTAHLWLDMWPLQDQLSQWIESKKLSWRHAVYSEAQGTVVAALIFSKDFEQSYLDLKSGLPPHKMRHAPGKRLALQFESKFELEKAGKILGDQQIAWAYVDSWSKRPMTRDVSWGIPIPEDIDPDLRGKTLYVWPDSLIAPISFTRAALAKKGQNPENWRLYWQKKGAKITQFLGQDNVFFYVVLQGAMWIGTQAEPKAVPLDGEYQLSDVIGSQLLLLNAEKFSKSTGNYYSADQMLDEFPYDKDQIRYYLALLGLNEKPSNFELKGFEERNRFLAGPLNAAFEKPLSACHSKFEGQVPPGELPEKILKSTHTMIKKYLDSMQKAEYSTLLFAIENYARLINSMFTQFKPHDDRYPLKDRENALYSSFYVLKNIMIMLYPFVPSTMDRLRVSLNLEPEVFNLCELGRAIGAGHKIGEKTQYFPPVAEKPSEP